MAFLSTGPRHHSHSNKPHSVSKPRVWETPPSSHTHIKMAFIWLNRSQFENVLYISVLLLVSKSNGRASQTCVLCCVIRAVGEMKAAQVDQLAHEPHKPHCFDRLYTLAFSWALNHTPVAFL